MWARGVWRMWAFLRRIVRQAVSMCVDVRGILWDEYSGIAGEELVVVGIFCVLFPHLHHTIITPSSPSRSSYDDDHGCCDGLAWFDCCFVVVLV